MDEAAHGPAPLIKKQHLYTQRTNMTAQTVELSELQKDAANLLFALSDAWPYVNKSCTINSVRQEVLRLLQKHGDFAELIEHKQKVDRIKELEAKNLSLTNALDKLYAAVVEKHQGTAIGEALYDAQVQLEAQKGK